MQASIQFMKILEKLSTLKAKMIAFLLIILKAFIRLIFIRTIGFLDLECWILWVNSWTMSIFLWMFLSLIKVDCSIFIRLGRNFFQPIYKSFREYFVIDIAKRKRWVIIYGLEIWIFGDEDKLIMAQILGMIFCS